MIMEASELVVLIRPKSCVCFILAEDDENSVNNLIGTVCFAFGRCVEFNALYYRAFRNKFFIVLIKGEG
jgi:hypothetical protein